MLIKHKMIALLVAMVTVYVMAVMTYSISESTSIADSIWWAFMTFTTVGYGDQFPQSLPGRAAGIFLVLTAVFLVIPAITAQIVKFIIGDEHLFSHEEQEEVKLLLRKIDAKLSDGGGKESRISGNSYNDYKKSQEDMKKFINEGIYNIIDDIRNKETHQDSPWDNTEMWSAARQRDIRQR